ncbi:probable amidase At4g34880 [Vicia villosa]|uniref:probable amidase At4g34880 n=1 Tax=Vicia villosa TaxID=3911 RepID=UPI00273B0BE8|nr:probable amidase At4g34880 [Vicia villosa]
MVADSLGTETDGSIIFLADHNSVDGIKPTVVLTSRDGPMRRTVSDAVHVLGKFIPSGSYKQFLNKQGLKGKIVGVLRNPSLVGSNVTSIFEDHINVLR